MTLRETPSPQDTCGVSADPLPGVWSVHAFYGSLVGPSYSAPRSHPRDSFPSRLGFPSRHRRISRDLVPRKLHQTAESAGPRHSYSHHPYSGESPARPGRCGRQNTGRWCPPESGDPTRFLSLYTEGWLFVCAGWPIKRLSRQVTPSPHTTTRQGKGAFSPLTRSSGFFY